MLKTAKNLCVFWFMLAPSSLYASSSYFGASGICSAWLANQAELRKDCHKNYRSFAQEFHPGGLARSETESYGWYAFSDSYSSHFVIGCVLDWNGEVRFIGVYYIPVDGKLLPLNSMKITNVDPDGNVNLDDKGVSIPLTPVQRFMDPDHREGENTAEIWKNCQTPLERNGLSYDARSNQTVDLSQFEVDRTVMICLESSCSNSKFILFNSMKIDRVVALSYRSSIIMQNGGVLVQEKFYNDFCKGKKIMDPTKNLNLKQYFCVAG